VLREVGVGFGNQVAKISGGVIRIIVASVSVVIAANTIHRSLAAFLARNHHLRIHAP
jgi:hypothetical protein